MKITILVNNRKSWVFDYLPELCATLSRDHDLHVATNHRKMPPGELCFMLGCTRIVPAAALKLHRHNLVVHASDLPQGRGFSPMVWQVLAGQSEIPVVLFEAVPKLDSGPIYERTLLQLNGTELLDELHAILWRATCELIDRFLAKYPDVQAVRQVGNETRYRQRTRADDEIPVQATILEIFDRLRVADNERYPLFFTHRNCTYLLKVYKVGAGTRQPGSIKKQGKQVRP